jgi:hypothetical protein
MIRRLIKNVLVLSLAAGLLAGAILAIGIIRYRVELRSIESKYGQPESPRAPASFVGYAEDGSRIALSSADRGLAVRYASRDCPFCKQDQEWAPLASYLQGRGIRVVVLASNSSQKYDAARLQPAGVPQAIFVGAEWLKQFPVAVTPTFLLFDLGEQLIWHKRGMLTAGDAAAVRQLVETQVP